MNYRKGNIPAGWSAMLIALASIYPLSAAHAWDIDTGNPNFTARWDNTFKYSTMWRVKGQNPKVQGGTGLYGAPGDPVNYNDGDNNFDTGPVSNRIDLLTELDLAWKRQFGVRASAAGWYDSVYNQSNANNSIFGSSSFSVGQNKFTKDTRDIMGRYIELLDAFVWDKGMVGSMPYTVRVGRHTLQYGETLFYGGNGIANAQGPIDVIKLVSVPGSQFKEILRPVGQASFNLQINDNLTLDGYYQFQWEKSRLPAVGSYLSNIDWVGPGSEQLFVQNLFRAGGGILRRGGDIDASDQGQGGFAVHYTPPDSDYRFGVYFANYHEKTPEIYFLPNGARGVPAPANPGVEGQIRLVYPENIKTFGASVTSSIGQLNWSRWPAEVSWRIDEPLNSDPQVDVTGTADNNNHPLYAVGNTMHANVNGIYVLQPNRFWQGGTVLAEVAWNYLMECTMNCGPTAANNFNPTGARDPRATDHGLIFRIIFDPAYFQVLPGLDVDVPINFGYNPYGRSVAIGGAGPFYGEDIGDLSIGLNGRYQQVWQFGVSYTHYIGAPNQFATPQGSGVGPGEFETFGQTLQDRDFVSFNIHRTF